MTNQQIPMYDVGSIKCMNHITSASFENYMTQVDPQMSQVYKQEPVDAPREGFGHRKV
jgi:hypothetical protein